MKRLLITMSMHATTIMLAASFLVALLDWLFAYHGQPRLRTTSSPS